MPPQPERQAHLRLAEPEKPRYRIIEFDPNTGEQIAIHEEHPDLAHLRDQLDGAHTEISSWRTRYANLKRDKDREARADERWPRAKAIFDYWRERCKHPRSKFDADRFNLIAPFLDRYSDELCRRAIDGAAFDPFTKRLKNGVVQRYDSIELIFRNADKFESFCNRAPRKPQEEQT